MSNFKKSLLALRVLLSRTTSLSKMNGSPEVFYWAFSFLKQDEVMSRMYLKLPT
jgi:hypothetical protein